MTTDAVEEADRTAGSGTAVPPERSARRPAEAVVAAMRADAERIKDRELAEALGELEGRDGLDDLRRDVVEGMADAIVDRLLAAPVTGVREAGHPSTLSAVVRLFDLDVEVDDGRREDGSRRPEVTGGDD